MVTVVECLPSMDKALGSLPSTTTWGWGWGVGVHEQTHWCRGPPKTTNQIHLVLTKLLCSQLEQQGTPPYTSFVNTPRSGFLLNLKLTMRSMAGLKIARGPCKKRKSLKCEEGPQRNSMNRSRGHSPRGKPSLIQPHLRTFHSVHWQQIWGQFLPSAAARASVYGFLGGVKSNSRVNKNL